MSKNFWEARSELIDALAKQRTELDYHRRALKVFKSVFEEMKDTVSDYVADVLTEAITMETAKVHSLEVEIRGTERLLKQYSLAPAN